MHYIKCSQQLIVYIVQSVLAAGIKAGSKRDDTGTLPVGELINTISSEPHKDDGLALQRKVRMLFKLQYETNK